MTTNRSVYRTTLLLALVTCTGIGGSAAAAIPPAYTVTDLGTLGGTFSQGRDINASGQVTGESYTTGNPPSTPFSTTARCTTWERSVERTVLGLASTIAVR